MTEDRRRHRGTSFLYRIDRWDESGRAPVEYVAGVQDFLPAMAAYHAACRRWPDARITLIQGGKVIADSRSNNLL
jgi:hypothetical protein